MTPRARQIAARAPLTLASRSPRRSALLRAAGVRFRIRAAGVPERRRPGEAARRMCLRLAADKASAAARGIAEGLVLGADTEVVLDGRPLGKPASPRAARRMLRALSGRAHTVLTALVLLDAATGARIGGVASSRVRFRRIDPDEARAYAASGEPMDKAGGYAIQGGAAGFVASLRGSRSNVLGLPMPLLSRLLLLAARRGMPAKA